MDNIDIMYKPYMVGVVIGGVYIYYRSLVVCMYTEAILMAACVETHERCRSVCSTICMHFLAVSLIH